MSTFLRLSLWHSRSSLNDERSEIKNNAEKDKQTKRQHITDTTQLPFDSDKFTTAKQALNTVLARIKAEIITVTRTTANLIFTNTTDNDV